MNINDILEAKKYPIKFRSLKADGSFGRTDFKKIEIDLKRDISIAKVYIHEVAHILEPDMSEKDILKIERAIWKKITQKQIHKVYKKIFS